MENNDKLIESLRDARWEPWFPNHLLSDAADALANYAIRCDSDDKIIAELQSKLNVAWEDNRRLEAMVDELSGYKELWLESCGLRER